MPALNFMKEMASKVLSGEKPHTIRAMRKRPFRVGDRLYFWVRQRRPAGYKFGEAICRRVDKIEIFGTVQFIWINDECLTSTGIRILAKRDGFNNIDDFFAFFNQHYFLGQIIWWNPETIMRAEHDCKYMPNGYCEICGEHYRGG